MSDQKKNRNGMSIEELKRKGSASGAEGEVKTKFLDYFKKNKSRVSFGEKVEALYEWMTSGQLTTRDKAIVIGALIYFINPMDLIPDITPFLGFSDDLGVIYLVYNYLQNRSLEEIAPAEDGESDDDTH